jgi:hypothetical protein
VLPSCRATAFGRRPKWPETHLIDETFGGEEYAAENCEPEKQITPQECVQYFLASGVRCTRQKIASVARALVTPGSKRLNLRTFELGSDEPASASRPLRGTRKKISQASVRTPESKSPTSL